MSENKKRRKILLIGSCLVIFILIFGASGISPASCPYWDSNDGHTVILNETTGRRYVEIGNLSNFTSNTILTVFGSLLIKGESIFEQYVEIDDDLYVTDDIQADGGYYCGSDSSFDGELEVGADSIFDANLSIGLDLTVDRDTETRTLRANDYVYADNYIESPRFYGGGIVPVGSIIMWYGNLSLFNAMNDGTYGIWAICNGTIQNGMYTPDMRSKVNYCPNTDADYNKTGGSASVTLNVGNLPAHNHLLPTNIVTAVSVGTNRYRLDTTTAVERVTVTTNSSSRNVGSGNAVATLPPYRQLYYIMRVG